MIITSSALRALNKGLQTLYTDAYHGAGQTPRIGSFAMRTSSASAEELYAWLGSMPGMKEILGDIKIQNLVDQNYAIKNKEFELTIGVKRVDLERDRAGIYNPLFTAMGVSARNHPDELLFARLEAGFTTTCYTGKNFFDANHEPEAGGQKFTNNSVLVLNADNFATLRARLKSRKNAKGKSMNLGSDLVLVVPPALEVMGRSIVVADTVPNGGTNVNKGTARLEVSSLITSDTAWFLLDLGQPIKPFIYQVEKETQFHSLTDLNSERLMLQREFLYQAEGRYNVGYGLPELAEGSTGAGA